MAVKGYTPPPDPQDFSSKFQLRNAQRAHEKFAKQAEEGRFVAKDKPDYQSASRHRNSEGNPLLQAAAVRRNSIAYGDNSYTNPMDFVRDMWADGFISSEQAAPLAEEFNALGGKPGQLMDAFLVQQHRLGHVTGRNRDDKRFILGVTGDRSHHVADELTQMRTYTDVERSPSEEAARTDDNRTDEARLRNQVLKSIAQRTDDPNVAFAVALEAVMKPVKHPLNAASAICSDGIMWQRQWKHPQKVKTSANWRQSRPIVLLTAKQQELPHALKISHSKGNRHDYKRLHAPAKPTKFQKQL